MIARVNYQKCDAVAQLIRSHGGFSPDREDPITIRLARPILGMVNLLAVAINHQTTPLVGQQLAWIIDGARCRGWDYLWRRMIQCAERDESFVKPETLAEMMPEKLTEFLADGNGGGIISDVSRRAAFIADIGRIMGIMGWETAEDVYARSGGCLLCDGVNGLRDLLRRFRAFGSDPLEKKSRYFLSLQRNACAWEYRDPENLGTPVDYHEERGHLRVETVEVLDPNLRDRIIRRCLVTETEDLAIRSAVMQAIEYIANVLGILPSTAHYAFWNYFRNCCSRDKTHCVSCADTCTLPERYKISGVSACVFAPVCASKGKPVTDMLLEASFNTDWY